MFAWLLAGLLVGAAVQIARERERTRARVGEVVLVWVLAGYCGLPMIAVAVGVIIAPARAAAVLGFPADSPFQAFLGWAYLGMALAAALALRWRGSFLLGPSVAWSVFFLGATFVHLHGPGHVHGLHARLAVLATHALVSVLLVTGLALGGATHRAETAGRYS